MSKGLKTFLRKFQPDDSINLPILDLDRKKRKDGPFKEYWENWNVRERGTYKNGELDGPYESYYENGQIDLKCTYKNGVKDGLCEMYHKNGQLYRRWIYKNGKFDGLYEVYYENGQLQERSCPKDNISNGPEELYSEDGQLKEVVIYKGAIVIDKKDRFLTPTEVLPDWEKEHPNPTAEDFLGYMYGTGENVITCIVRAGSETLDRFFPADKWATIENIPTLTKIFAGVPQTEELVETMSLFDRKLKTIFWFNQHRAQREKCKTAIQESLTPKTDGR